MCEKRGEVELKIPREGVTYSMELAQFEFLFSGFLLLLYGIIPRRIPNFTFFFFSFVCIRGSHRLSPRSLAGGFIAYIGAWRQGGFWRHGQPFRVHGTWGH